MDHRLEAESTLTDRYQTTVPASVRRAMRIGKRDKILYTIGSDGKVVLSRAPVEGADDPVLGHFLAFLTQDIERHPERLRAINSDLIERVRALTEGVEVDLDAPLPAEDE